MDRSRERALRTTLLGFDALLIILAMALSWGAHEWLRAWLPLLRDPPAFPQYALLAFFALPLMLVCIASLELDRLVERPRTERELFRDLLKLHAVVLVGLALLLLLTQTSINRSLLGLFLTFTFLVIFAERSLLGRWQRFQHAAGQSRPRLLVVGTPSEQLRDFLKEAGHGPLPPEFVGFIDEAPGQEPVAGVPLRRMGGLADLERLLHAEAIDQVLFFHPFHRPSKAKAALAACETVGVPASFAVDLTRRSAAQPRIDLVCGRPFVSYELSPKPPGPLLMKHGLDVLFAAMGLAALSPLLLSIAVAILVSMGRPVFFTQARAGRNGRRFQMLKFRTMVADAEAQRDALSAQNMMSGPVFKVADDPRVTRLGRFLRRTSLDELPQLVNVVMGQMSLVGPRPLPCKEQEQIRGWHRRRLAMRPGITGLWQASGRSRVDFEEWMRMDLEYVDRWSLGLDVKILLKTLPAVLRGRGAC